MTRVPNTEGMSDQFERDFRWQGPTFDPNDEYFGDVVEGVGLEDAGDHDAVLVGEPTDDGQVGARGAALGPAGLRTGLSETKTAHLQEEATLSVGDLGDMALPWGASLETLHERIRTIAASVHEVDAVPVFLGGGHDLAYPNVVPLIERHGSVGVVNVDAHADVREPVEGPYNGTPFRQAFEAGLEEYALVGGRHFETSGAYLAYLRERDCEVVPAAEAGNDPQGAARRALNSLGDVDVVHVSCDLDVLDMSVAPGMNAPTPGGLLSRELYAVLGTLLSDPRVASLDVIGCSPPLESDTQRLQQPNVGPVTMAGARAVAHAVHAVATRS